MSKNNQEPKLARITVTDAEKVNNTLKLVQLASTFSILAQSYTQMAQIFKRISDNKSLSLAESTALNNLPFSPGSGTPKRKKVIVDPDAPKRPLSSYIRFCNDQRDNVRAQFPELSTQDASKKLGELWNNLPADEKEVFFILQFNRLVLQ